MGQRLGMKDGKRRQNRTLNLRHNATKSIVDRAFEKKKAVVLETIRGIRQLYRKGNWQGRSFRGRMNGWSFGKAQYQIEYKATCLGYPVVRFSSHVSLAPVSSARKSRGGLQANVGRAH